MKKHLFIYILTVCMACFIVEGQVQAKDTSKITNITFEKYEKTLTIKKGEKKKLKVRISPENAANKELKWSTSNQKIVSVTSKGVITGKKKGKATITVSTTDGSKKKAKLKVTVGKKVKRVTFRNADALNKLEVKDSFRLKTSVFPKNASNKKVEWSSSDNRIATVDAKGNVMGISNGTVVITAKAADGSGKKVSKMIQVVTKVQSVTLSLKSKTAYCTALNDYGVYVKKDYSFTVLADVQPEDTSDKNLEWTSSNPEVAIVSSDGKVKTLNCGSALITAKALDGSGKKDVFTVYVGSMDKEDCTFVAHRGRSEEAPDNSMAAIRLALQSEFDCVEFDIWNTADNQFVVTHDESLKEPCGVDVKVTDLTLEQATSYKIIAGKNISYYPNEYIPSLVEVLQLAQFYPDKQLYIELKSILPKDRVQALLDMIYAYNLQERVTIITFYGENIEIIRSMSDYGGDVLPMQYLHSTPNMEALQFCIKYGVGLGAKYNSISKRQIDILHQHGLEVNVWGIPNFYTACYMVYTMKVDSSTTDYEFFE